MAVAASLLKDVLALDAPSRAELVDELLASLDQPDQAIDTLWAAEAESRIDAYDRGEIGSVSVHEVMARYEKK
ncbi:MAG: addiction module protein [Zetaproteobacteria bacterium]|nr:addiction module protein [Zetaproteobacteria bacterium]